MPPLTSEDSAARTVIPYVEVHICYYVLSLS